MALIKKVKNNTETVKTWCGQEIAAGEYYEIESNRWMQWAHDNAVLDSISDQELIVNDGNSDLVGTAIQINYLRVLVEGETIFTDPANTYGMQLNAINGSCDANSSVNIDFKLENYEDYPNAGQDEAYTYKYLWGGWCRVPEAVYGDFASFCIIDKDNILGYGENFIIKYYIKKSWIFPNELHQYESAAPGEIPLGLYLRCTYTAVNAGSTRNIYLMYDIETKE